MVYKAEQLIILLLIILVLFGGKKLPELAKSIGASIREVKRGFSDEEAAEKEVSIE